MSQLSFLAVHTPHEPSLESLDTQYTYKINATNKKNNITQDQQNERYVSCHNSVLQGSTGPGTTWANEMNFGMNHAPGPGSITQLVDQ